MSNERYFHELNKQTGYKSEFARHKNYISFKLELKVQVEPPSSQINVLHSSDIGSKNNNRKCNKLFCITRAHTNTHKKQRRNHTKT